MEQKWNVPDLESIKAEVAYLKALATLMPDLTKLDILVSDEAVKKQIIESMDY